MYKNDTRKKLEDIIGGIILEGQIDNCSAARNFLCPSFETSTTIKKDFDNQSKIKEEQSKFLRAFITTNNLWISEYPQEERYIS